MFQDLPHVEAGLPNVILRLSQGVGKGKGGGPRRVAAAPGLAYSHTTPEGAPLNPFSSFLDACLYFSKQPT